MTERINELIQEKQQIRRQYSGRRMEEEVLIQYKFIRPCPADDCRGFLGTDWVCKLCSTNVCSKCGELKDEDHECNPDLRASFELIRSESKNCPNCGVPITKISGCDHMFCTDCKVAFSWRTMEIQSQGNSNPLYWQWRQTRPQDSAAAAAPETQCRPEDRLGRIRERLYDHYTYDRDDSIQIVDSIIHLRGYVMPQFNLPIVRDEMRRLRVQFLLKEISESEWKLLIQRVDKKQRKARFIVSILDSFTLAATDILDGFQTSRPHPQIRSELEELRTMYNEELTHIDSIFGSTVYDFGERNQFRARPSVAAEQE